MHTHDNNHYAVYSCSYCVEPIELTSNGIAVYFQDTDKWVFSCDNCQTLEAGSPSFFELDFLESHFVSFAVYKCTTMLELEYWLDGYSVDSLPQHAKYWLLSYADRQCLEWRVPINV